MCCYISPLFNTCVSSWSCLSFRVQEASSWVMLVSSSVVCVCSPSFRSPKSTLGTLRVTMGPYPKITWWAQRGHKPHLKNVTATSYWKVKQVGKILTMTCSVFLPWKRLPQPMWRARDGALCGKADWSQPSLVSLQSQSGWNQNTRSPLDPKDKSINNEPINLLCEML